MIEGDVEGALEDVNVPSYAIDRHGVIRWLNPAAQRLVGDARGRQFTSVVAPEETLEAREIFARKIFGKDGATDKETVLIAADGRRVDCEISATPLRDDGRIVGVFGLVTHALPATSTASHPHLTPAPDTDSPHARARVLDASDRSRAAPRGRDRPQSRPAPAARARRAFAPRGGRNRPARRSARELTNLG